MIIDAPSEVFGSKESWQKFLDMMIEMRGEVTRPDDIKECDEWIEIARAWLRGERPALEDTESDGPV